MPNRSSKRVLFDAPLAPRSQSVVLVSMPFGPLFTPSIALGLLSAQLERSSIECTSLYLTVTYANMIGIAAYNTIANGEPGNHFLLGDWVFRDTLFGAAAEEQNTQYLQIIEDAFSGLRQNDRANRWETFHDLRADIVNARSAAEKLVETAVEQILEKNPAVVGFTTIFQQNIASLAAARRVKQRSPQTYIVFGGANCEDVMGTEMLERFPFIDAVVSGEGDAVFAPLVESILQGREPRLAGVTTRNTQAKISAQPIQDLDSLPYPDYTPYFDQVRAIAPEIEKDVRLLYETSRGCWWGQRSHCTFCGLNGTSMAFRSKSAARAYTELQWLTSEYAGHAVSVVDNILDMKYFTDFIPMLARQEFNVDLFYEVKANLKKSQLAQLRDANISMIQPGVESLDDDVLKLMRKGVSSLQNVQLIKWCLELGIDAHWNLIWGFPKEGPEAYARMAALVPLINHLPPPKSFSPIRLDRFSPNFKEPAEHGIVNVRPFPAYDYVYDAIPPESRHQIAYYFTFDYDDRRDIRSYTRELQSVVAKWQEDHDRVGFFSVAVGEKLLLCDLRDSEKCSLSLLDNIDSKIYRRSDTACTLHDLHVTLQEESLSESDVAARVDRMVRSRFILQSGTRYLSLAIEAGTYVPPAPVLQRFRDYVAANSSSDDRAVSHIPISVCGSERTSNPHLKEATLHGA